MNEEQAKLWTKKHEGLRLNPYLDTTGHVTVGWGRNLDNGIRVDEAELMFKNDYEQAARELERFDWYQMQPTNVKFALIDMNFNLGITKLLQFKSTIRYLKEKNYTAAARQILNSLYAKQVGQRAKDIAVMIREGK